MQLNQILTTTNRVACGAALLLGVVLTYTFTNIYYLGQPVEVPLTIVDLAIPLSPVWIWIYISYYFYLIGIFLNVRNEKVLNQLFWSYLSAGILSAAFFYFYPTTIIRNLYPVVSENHSWSESLLLFIRYIDQSQSCAPSQHIAFSVIAAMAFWQDRESHPKFRIAVSVWALLISYSTMATKQHYFIDVVSGFALGAGVFLAYGFTGRRAPLSVSILHP